MAESQDAVDRIRAGLDSLGEHPVGQHVPILTSVLDTIIAELDELARTIPPAR